MRMHNPSQCVSFISMYVYILLCMSTDQNYIRALHITLNVFIKHNTVLLLKYTQ